VSRSLPTTAGPWETRLFGIIAVVLVGFGILAIYSASGLRSDGTHLALGQLYGAILGIALMLVATRIDYHLWRRIAWPLLSLVALLLLILLLPFAGFMTLTLNDSTRWISLPYVRFQPSELAKFAVIAWTAMLAAKKGATIREFKRGLLPFIVILAPLCLMVWGEPDFSTACLLALLAGVILFTAGAKIGHFLVVGLAVIALAGTDILRGGYRFQRVLTFLSPGEDPMRSSWQIRQSLLGFGSGGLFGAGFGKGSQKLGYLPEAHSDFIYSTVGEEWGFIGAAIIVLLYGVLITLGFRVARTAPDRFGMLLATGITVLIGISAFTHIAVNLALAPTTGLPLPFISHGRTSLVVSLFATGVLVNIGHSRFKTRKHR
jgi:cell division protein FtsW